MPLFAQSFLPLPKTLIYISDDPLSEVMHQSLVRKVSGLFRW
jgi:hypothetical protein